jgi:hypothetical protein
MVRFSVQPVVMWPRASLIDGRCFAPAEIPSMRDGHELSRYGGCDVVWIDRFTNRGSRHIAHAGGCRCEPLDRWDPTRLRSGPTRHRCGACPAHLSLPSLFRPPSRPVAKNLPRRLGSKPLCGAAPLSGTAALARSSGTDARSHAGSRTGARSAARLGARSGARLGARSGSSAEPRAESLAAAGTMARPDVISSWFSLGA